MIDLFCSREKVQRHHKHVYHLFVNSSNLGVALGIRVVAQPPANDGCFDRQNAAYANRHLRCRRKLDLHPLDEGEADVCYLGLLAK